MRMLFLHRNHATVGDFTDHVFELNRSVVNSKVVVQALFNFAQNPLAGGRWNVGDRDVA
jgi:hypothetical protein